MLFDLHFYSPSLFDLAYVLIHFLVNSVFSFSYLLLIRYLVLRYLFLQLNVFSAALAVLLIANFKLFIQNFYLDFELVFYNIFLVTETFFLVFNFKQDLINSWLLIKYLLIFLAKLFHKLIYLIVFFNCLIFKISCFFFI